MKIILLRFLLIIFVLSKLLSCQYQKANETPKTYVCNYTNRALIIDGKLDDSQWKMATWSDNFTDIEGYTKPQPEFRTQMKMLFDRHYLYIGARMEEPELWATLTKHDAIIYHDNDFEVFIDPAGDGFNYYELEINALVTVLDLFLDKPYNKNGTADISWDFKGIKSAVSYIGTLNDASDKDSCWTAEIAIPWEAFSADSTLPPKEGEQWRMNFSRVEWKTKQIGGKYIKQTDPVTGKNLPEYNWVWSPQGVINMHVPEHWGYVRFSGAPAFSNLELPEFWVWINGGNQHTSTEWDSIFLELKNTGIDGLLINCDTSTLRKIIPLAKARELQVHAWIWTMNSMEAKPEWLSVNRLGQSLASQKAYVDYYHFMCPALPEVKQFIFSKINELTAVEGLNGIHLDYIRYVDAILPKGLWDKYGLIQDHIMPEYDYGYHPYMRKLFEEQYGIDPLYLEDAENDTNWLNFRLQELDKTVIDIRDYVGNKGLTISAAVFPTPELSRKMVRQDWDSWGLDCYFPMVYHNFYDEKIGWIEKVIREDKAHLPEGTRIYCGLFLPALKEKDDLTKAMQAAFSGGADGIAFFDINTFDNNLQKEIAGFIRKRNRKIR